MNTARQIPENDLDPDAFDKSVRDMLGNWALWEKGLDHAIPQAVPAKQPMFREVKSGYNVEDDRSATNNTWPRFDEAVYSESVITKLSKHDRSVLERYFIKEKNTVICAQRMRMSRRKFEMWLNTAIGKFAARVEDDDEGMAFVFRIMIERKWT